MAAKTTLCVLPYRVFDSNDMKFWLDPSFTNDMWVDLL